jgi:hypothetical protein
LQHDVVLHSLYSTKAFGSKARFFDIAIAQARADVFYHLLFGARVVCSAGAFFDSPIALKIFGEILQHDLFARVQDYHQWFPLAVNTDSNEAVVSAPQYIRTRWALPDARFSFFREYDQVRGNFLPEKTDMKRNAAACLNEENYFIGGRSDLGRLEDILSPLFEPYKFERPHAVAARLSRSSMPAILKPGIGEWFRAFFKYFQAPGTFVNRESAPQPQEIERFSPIRSITLRAQALETDSFGIYKKDKLAELCSSFEAEVSHKFFARELYMKGPKHFGLYYPIVSHWAEAGWHTARHRAYGSATAVTASDWALSDILDFEKAEKVISLENESIPDDQELRSANVSDFDWAVLFEVIMDKNWRPLIRRIKEETDPRPAAEQLLRLVASKHSTFRVQQKSLRLTFSLGVATVLSTFGHIVKDYDTTFGGIFGPDVLPGVLAASMVASATKDGLSLLNTALGFRVAHQEITNLRLRRAIIPRLTQLIPDDARSL